MSKYKIFKPGDKVYIKTLEQIKKEFKLYHTDSTGREIYLGEFDLYFSPPMDKFCGKEVTIDSRVSDDMKMTEGDDDYEFWSHMYDLVEPIIVDGKQYNIEGKTTVRTMWSVEMFKEGREDQLSKCQIHH